ncbi:hypothetical protein LWF01_06310 [Saxibacter everestensis]|uniref:Helix-turn-helix domain-containing protein n=1 Tax=Saxibacter everestensis TaxID=2909229 RepID=A0ABY8QYC9_9MICO|nr:hypothetical protein LWF01_06310 [Brevibacteriaceae bacterium ZFBP1038]
MSTTIDVTATRWSGGWELAIDGDPVTQVRTLVREQQVSVADAAALLGVSRGRVSQLDEEHT